MRSTMFVAALAAALLSASGAPARTAPNTVVAWPTNADGFVLEAVSALPGTNWAPETSLRGIVNTEFNVTNFPGSTNRFFRLKGL